MKHRIILFMLLVCAAAASVSVTVSTQRQQAPGAQAQGPRKKLLFLTYPGVAFHASLDNAEKTVTELGKNGGFDVTIGPNRPTSLQGADKVDLSFFTPDYLNQFDGLMMMTNGNPPFTEAQKKSMVDFVRNGKALIGAHCATVTFYDY